MVTLSPSPMTVVPVCHVGDPLQITCTASVEFMQWSILRINELGTLEKITNDVILSSTSSNMMMQRVNSVLFTFMRVSAQEALPLISTLSVDSVSTDLNGTVVHCLDVGNLTSNASTTIEIIDSKLHSHGHTYPLCMSSYYLY